MLQWSAGKIMWHIRA